MSQTSLHVYCLFSGLSMSLPYGNPEDYRLASQLAISLVGPGGRTQSNAEENFYLETAEQLDALFDLQRSLKKRSSVRRRP